MKFFKKFKLIFLHIVRVVKVLRSTTNYSIKHQSVVSTQFDLKQFNKS